MSAHTPGPWKADRWMSDEGGCYGWSFSASGYLLPLSDMETDNPDECDANARLISAAPDLLEALVDVMFRHVPFSNKEAYAEKARAAILKATGEQA